MLATLVYAPADDGLLEGEATDLVGQRYSFVARGANVLKVAIWTLHSRAYEPTDREQVSGGVVVAVEEELRRDQQAAVVTTAPAGYEQDPSFGTPAIGLHVLAPRNLAAAQGRHTERA